MKAYFERHYKKLAYADILFGGLFLLFGSIGFVFLLSEGNLPPSSALDVVLGSFFGGLMILTGYSMIEFGFEGKKEILGWINIVVGLFIWIDGLATVFISSSEIPKLVKIFGASITLVAALLLALGGYYLKNYDV